MRAVDAAIVRLPTSRLAIFALLLVGVCILNAALRVLDDTVGTQFVVSPGPNRHFSERDYADNIGDVSVEAAQCPEPIDAVYTWVNGSEPEQKRLIQFWQARQQLEEAASAASAADDDGAVTSTPHLNHSARRWRHHYRNRTSGGVPPSAPPPTAARETLPPEQVEDQSSASRFEDHDELLYSLRSLERFAPWIRRVYIVTNGQVPTWLDLHHPRIRVVPHATIFPNAADHLPTFSSPAIEAHLHRIPGLSRRFVYLNDDTFFGSPVVPDDFYSPTKGHRIYFSWPVPNCAQGCPNSWLADGFCDRACNTTDCDWDGGDCLKSMQSGGGGQPAFNAQPPSSPAAAVADSDTCEIGCRDEWLGDHHCDPACNVAACAYDGGDCSGSGLLQLPSLNGWNASAPARRQRRFTVSSAVPAFTVNLAPWIGPADAAVRIVSGDVSEAAVWVRSATVIEDRRVLVVTVNSASMGIGSRLCHVRIVVELVESPLRNASNDHHRKVSSGGVRIPIEFNVTIVEPTAPPGGANATTAASLRPPLDQQQQQMTTTTAPPDDKAKQWPDFPKGSPQEAFAHYAEMAAKVSGHAPPRRPSEAGDDGGASGKAASLAQSHEQQARGARDAARMRMHGGRRDLLSVPSPAVPSSAGTRVVDSRLREETRRLRNRLARTKQLKAEVEAARAELSWRQALRATASSVSSTADGRRQQSESTATRRRLLDMFGDSLKFANKLLTKRFGSQARKVPAHMVHLIDRDVIRDVWRLFPDEYDATSASRFRSKRNLQYGFLHFYYIIHAMRDWTADDFFDEMVDLDRSGRIDTDVEVRRVALLLFEKGVKLDDLRDMVLDRHANATAMLDQQLGVAPDPPSSDATVVEDAPELTKPPSPTTSAAGQRTLLSAARVSATSSSTSGDDQGEEGHSIDVSKLAAEEAAVEREARALGIDFDTSGDDEDAEELRAEAVARLAEASSADAADPPRRVGHGLTRTTTSSFEARPGRREIGVVHRRGNNSTTAATPTPAVVTPAPPAATPLPTMWTPAPPANPDDSIVPLTDEFVELTRLFIDLAVTGPEAFAVDNTSVYGKPTLVRKERWLSRPTDPGTPMTRREFALSSVAQELISRNGVGRYKYTLEEQDDITFFMVRDNATVVQHQMDHVLYKRNKFLCINDNMNHSHENHTEVVKVLHALFRGYFPEPSSFELRGDRRNGFTRLAVAELAELYAPRNEWWNWTIATLLREGDLPMPATEEERVSRMVAAEGRANAALTELRARLGVTELPWAPSARPLSALGLGLLGVVLVLLRVLLGRVRRGGGAFAVVRRRDIRDEDVAGFRVGERRRVGAAALPHDAVIPPL